MSVLNDLRRNAILGLENLVIKSHLHNLEKIKIENLVKIPSPKKTPNLSLLLNILNENFDYTTLRNIDKLYIPLKYFYNLNFSNLLAKLTNKFNVYVYMPHIIRDAYIRDLDILKNFNIKGFVISHISQLGLISKYNLEIIGNYNLNIYNNYSIEFLKNLKIGAFTISPELSKNEVIDILDKTPITSELIVYGNIPVMTNNYCYLGKSNKCYKECDKKCMHKNSKFYLKDRMNYKFRILPDNFSTITTIYNCKITSIKYEDFKADFIRIDILDETIEEIEQIIDTIKSGNRFEGKKYTNGRIS